MKPLTPAQQRYRAYLNTPHWRRVRARILERAHDECEWCHRFCGRNPHLYSDPRTDCGDQDCAYCRAYFEDGEPLEGEKQTIEVHHMTYERLGAERDEDLVALCWSCHDEITERADVLKQLYRHRHLPKEMSTIRAAATRFWSVLFGWRQRQ